MLSINNTAEGYLKNVEIKGNTIQGTDLADIRSVGDKVEGQELYEIPLLSVGKNLFDGEFLDGVILSTTGTESVNVDRCTSKEYIKFKPNANCFLSNSENYGITRLVAYDKNKNFIKTLGNGGVTPENCAYIRFTLANKYTTTNNVQLEEGTQATPYEPYQEHKLTILSPCQIEKVGDVADILYENGDIDKYIINFKEFNSNNVKLVGIEDSITRYSITVNSNHSNIKTALITSVVPTQDLHGTNGAFCYPSVLNRIDVRVNTNELESSTVESFLKWANSKNLTFKYVRGSIATIPLPHAQQVKLRTFANKTNISFLCDVEGTIKADVPKSLGATVNTHTTQIDSLNQELDRVKKLEESTVSTVVTDKDFEVVEQTTQGYFEDVELKGKTLVNKFDQSSWKLTDSIDGKNVLKFSGYVNPSDGIPHPNCFILATNPPKGTYTISGNFKSTTYTNKITARYLDGTSKSSEDLKSNFEYDIKSFEVDSNCTHLYINTGSSSAYGYVMKDSLLFLEGDHTQNPPSYFEGLKSVGDGTDEIVVSSVNGNLLNLLDSEQATGVTTYFNVIDENLRIYQNVAVAGVKGHFIPKGANKKVSFRCKNAFNVSRVSFLMYEGSKLVGKVFDGSNFVSGSTYSADIPSNVDKFVFSISDSSKTSHGSDTTFYIELEDIIISTTPKPYTPHKADKKKLLYFDPSDSTWKKPILDEFSTVKKGSDGVYRYYKRGGIAKVTQDQVKSWSVPISTNTNAYRLDGVGSAIVGDYKANGICDKLKAVPQNELYSKDEEGINCNNGNIYIRLNKGSNIDVTVVYQLATEEVYECTNIDLITYQNETNYIAKSGVLSPTTVLKVHSNISNVVSLLQKKVSLLERNIKADQATQNAIILDTDMRVMDIEFVLMESMGLTLNEGGNTMFKKNERGINEFNLMKERIESGEYTSEYLEKCINKYKHANRLSQEEYDILYDMIYPPVYDIPTVLPN